MQYVVTHLIRYIYLNSPASPLTHFNLDSPTSPLTHFTLDSLTSPLTHSLHHWLYPPDPDVQPTHCKKYVNINITTGDQLATVHVLGTVPIHTQLLHVYFIHTLHPHRHTHTQHPGSMHVCTHTHSHAHKQSTSDW